MDQRRTSPRRKERGDKPPATNRSLSGLLGIYDIQLQELAEAAGRKPGTLSDYARRKTLSHKMYWDLSACFADLPVAEQLLALVEAVDRAEMLDVTAPAAVASELGSLAEQLAVALPRRIEELAAERERQRFQTLWGALRHLTVAEWQRLIEALAPLRSPAFVALLGEESTRAASDDAGRALELANLTLWVAKRVAGEESRRQCESYAWAFVGNARRVGNHLKGAEEAFALSAALWQAESPETAMFLPGWRLLDLEASLRIDLRQTDRALALLEQAAEAAPRSGDFQARILSQRSAALMQIGDTERAIEALERGLSLLDLEAEPRLLCILSFNLMDSLCEVGRAAEAEGMLGGLRALTAQIGNGLDSLRLRWLEAKIAAGVGRTVEAIEALSRVRVELADKTLRADEGLASMELAALYLEQGRTADVKVLVRQMEPIFRDQGIHEEARKALQLFRRAVELEKVTLELVRRVVTYLYRAQHNPELRFEERQPGSEQLGPGSPWN